MSEKFNPETDCPGCGQTLIVLKGGIRTCPTEDAVQNNEILPKTVGIARDEIIVIDGEQIINPFGTRDARIKTLFDRAHSIRFQQLKDAWYPEQKRDWSAA
ncbi:hypothetical protein SEA_PAVLO_79 [Microbacterium phage Pavlo]|nr:hypothetical protein SEA_PAVLO_79 [Microbacterium phage Pavlo]